MPRIRKEKTEQNSTAPFWKIGLYIRLSKEDENENESESIINQEKILRDFVERYFAPATFDIVDVFADDGLTGTDTFRPSFQRLKDCMIRKEVNCMIIKSLARGFRNLADQQKFLEEFIPLYGARFICIGTPFIDTYTNPPSACELEVPIRGMFNEQFAATTSEEIRRTFRMKRERGEFIGAFAPYGYQKDPNDKNKLLVDEEAAEVVKHIFHWFVNEGYSKLGIAKKLNQMGELNPEAYKKKKGLKYAHPNSAQNDHLWSPATISRILQNEIYTGTMVQGRHRIISYKVHKQINVPKQDWFIVPNTHEAIIEKNMFARAQELHQRDTRTANGKQKVYTLSGFLYCADCKKALRRKTARGITYYECRSYTDKKTCSKHSIRQDRLENAVLKALQLQIALADGMEKSIESIYRAAAHHRESNHLSRCLQQAEKQLQRCFDASDDLYIDWKCGEISKEEYQRLKYKFSQQIPHLKATISSLKEGLQSSANDSEYIDPNMDAFLQHQNITNLSRGLVAALIKAIWVHENGAITIDFNFSDEYLKRSEDDNYSPAVIEKKRSHKRFSAIKAGGNVVHK